MRLALTAAAIAAFSTQSSAAEWWLVAVTKDHRAVFVDRESITDASTASRRLMAASTQAVSAAPDQGRGTVKRFTTYFGCNGRYSGAGSSIFSDPDGMSRAATANAGIEARLAPARENSGDRETLIFGCNEKKIIEGEAQFSISGTDFFHVEDPTSSAGVYRSYSGKPN